MVRRCSALLALAALVSTSVPARAQMEPDLATVRKHMKAAVGLPPLDDRIVTNFVSGTLTGSETLLRSGDDVRSDTVAGPFRYASGSVGGVAWSQNANGETVIHTTAKDEPAGEATTTTLSHVSAPADEYVIATLTALGMGTKTYVDAATWRIVRLEVVEPSGTTTTTYDDYRSNGGYTIPWHTHVSDGHAENESDFTVASFDDGQIPRERLAIPANRRTLVEFPAGRPSVELPAHVIDPAHKFVVRLDVGERGLDFELDTGASGIYMDRDVAQSLRLKEYGAFSSAANAGRYVGTQVIVPSISIGPLKMHDVVAQTIPHSGDEDAGVKVVGLLGFDFIDELGLKLDYKRGTLTAFAPSAITAPAQAGTFELDIRLGSYVPETDIAINEALGTHFTLDTGGAGAIIVTDYFRRRYPKSVVDEDHSDREVGLQGVGGAFRARVEKIAEIVMGKLRFTDFDALVITESKLYAGKSDGFVGPELFKLFTVYVDYQEQKVYLTLDDR